VPGARERAAVPFARRVTAARRSNRQTVARMPPTDPAADLWRPLVVRGVPLHFVLPGAVCGAAIALLASGGMLAIVGGWLLTVGFGVSVGAFRADQRALAAPAAAWAVWLAVAAIVGAPLPQTSPWAAVVFAGCGAACVWLGQRAVQPAVDQPRRSAPARRLPADFDELLTPEHDPADSPSLDPTADVDDALVERFDDDDFGDAEEPDADDEADDTNDTDDEADADDADEVDDADADADEAEDADADADATDPDATTDADAETGDDFGGQVIEFAALTDDDVSDVGVAPLPAATHAGRGHDAPSVAERS
jgi:hypothetical protein